MSAGRTAARGGVLVWPDTPGSRGRKKGFPMSEAISIFDRQGELRLALPRVEQLLQRRQAGQIGEGLIDELVNLSWIEWNGGSLRLTTTGQNICRQQLHMHR